LLSAYFITLSIFLLLDLEVLAKCALPVVFADPEVLVEVEQRKVREELLGLDLHQLSDLHRKLVERYVLAFPG